MAAQAPESSAVVPRQLSLKGKVFPPSIPLIISSQDTWNRESCQLETTKPDPNNHSLKLVEDALELLRTIDKPLAILAICGPYRSGKSYFMSRVLGSPGVFKLGHSMQACTRGIWMATTVLECQEFSTVLLDTEGIDSVGASETMAMSLLTLTTLLSSYLIYNSRNVPQKLDLDKMRCFSQLSSTVLSQSEQFISNAAAQRVFPHFLWLLRDVSLKMTDKEGKELQPTEFLHTRLLASESGELTDLGKSLVSIFPLLECATLPPPSTRANIIRDIFNCQSKLSQKFNSKIDALIQQILQKITPKQAVDTATRVNGKVLAALAECYVEAINKPGAIPDLDQGWQAVVRLELKECSYRLVQEYEAEMGEILEGSFPMEEDGLLIIHQQVLEAKKVILKEEIRQINPLHASDEDVQPLLDQLEHDIVQWSEQNATGEREVVGGSLLQFTTQNFRASKEYCEELLKELMKKSDIQHRVSEALRNSEPLDIQTEVEEIIAQYEGRAVGPATGDILDKGLSDLGELTSILKKIPGKPRDVWIIGQATDRIKLSWIPPEHNPEAVEEYVVYKKAQDGEWKEVVRTKKTKALVKGLKCMTTHEFQVVATNSTITSLASGETSESIYPSALVSAAGVGAGAATALCLPYAIGASCEGFKQNKSYGADSKLSQFQSDFLVGLSLATLPLSIALTPITAPIFALATAAHFKVDFADYQEGGDLTDD